MNFSPASMVSLIRLTKPRSATLNASGETLKQALYEVDDVQSLTATFQSVVVEGNDPLQGARVEARNTLLPQDVSSADRIVNFLRTKLRVDT